MLRSVGLVSATVLLLLAAPVQGARASQGGPSPGGPDGLGLPGLSYAPYQAGQDPNRGQAPSAAEVASDVALMAPHARALRTYAATNGSEHVPAAAARLGMAVAQGAWLDHDAARNEAEIARAIGLARGNPNVRRMLVGNEAILRGDLPVERLAAHMARVRAETGLPVSTSEPWHVWLRHPALAEASDYLAVHLLPYWDGVPVEEAPAYLLMRIEELRRAYPGKPVVVTEVGWPSGGPVRGGAVPGPGEQARFLDLWRRSPAAREVEWYWLEAFDQPWKEVEERGLGGNWGLWRADRRPKVPQVAPPR